MRLGTLLYEAGRFAEALAAFQQASADQEAPAASPGVTDEARVNLAAAGNGIGAVLWKTHKLPEAEAELRRALAIRQGLADDRPAPAYRGHLADTHLRLAVLLADRGRPSEAEAEFRERWRSGGSWPMRIPPSLTSASVWRRSTSTSACYSC